MNIIILIIINVIVRIFIRSIAILIINFIIQFFITFMHSIFLTCVLFSHFLSFSILVSRRSFFPFITLSFFFLLFISLNFFNFFLCSALHSFPRITLFSLSLAASFIRLHLIIFVIASHVLLLFSLTCLPYLFISLFPSPRSLLFCFLSYPSFMLPHLIISIIASHVLLCPYLAFSSPSPSFYFLLFHFLPFFLLCSSPFQRGLKSYHLVCIYYAN